MHSGNATAALLAVAASKPWRGPA